ncbi:cysteine synthase family protein [Parasphingorhabdus sp.]|uniref:PLP-dependent cysteine synthase family protein n=1 Tax=Parasphingorhabdus sp. TaxID=2709688 RepID=UPI0032F01025
MGSRKGLLSSVADTIGDTPLVALDRVTSGYGGRIFAKIEFLNPGFSKKDRAALKVIDEAKGSGALKPGQPVLEMTSGNMGTGLAIVCASRGHPFIAVMSRGNSVERARMMSALGAEVVLVSQAKGASVGNVGKDDLELVRERASALANERQAFFVNQFENPGNSDAHFEGTGPEIWEQSGGSATSFCDFVGSGGTFAGVSRYLKQQNPDVRCYVTEPTDAAVLAGCDLRDPNHPIQGGG